MATDIFQHIPKVSQELINYVDNVALLRSRYLFVSRIAGNQFAFCTHCKKEYTPNFFVIGKLMHNEERICEKCGSLCVVKDSWRGRSKLIDEAYVVWYEKSAINPKAIVAQGLHVKRDFSGDFRNVETTYYIPVIYLFEPGDPKANGKERFGKSRMIRQNWKGRSVEAKSVFSERNRYAKRLRAYVSEENIKSAVEGTPLQYSQWQEFLEYRDEDSDEWHGFNIFRRYLGESYTDLIAFFDLATRYPCVEYLVKMGLKVFVNAKINGYDTYKTINWRGTSVEKVLKLSREEVRELRKSLVKIDDFAPLSMYSYRFHKERGITVTFEQAHLLRDLTNDYYRSIMSALPVSYDNVVKYVLKQLARKKKKKLAL